MVRIIVTIVAVLMTGVGSVSGAIVGEQTPHAPNPACDRASYRVVLDVGHTAQSPGATSARGVAEYEFNLALAREVERTLIDAGFAKTLVLVTSGPSRRALDERVRNANAAKAQLFVSIHHDSAPEMFKQDWEFGGMQRRYSDRFRGHSIFVSFDNPQRQASLRFASRLGRHLKASGLDYTPHYAERFMGRWRKTLVDAATGVYRYDELIVLRTTRMPAVLLEAGSIIHRDEEIVAMSPQQHATVAAALRDAVEETCSTHRSRQPRKPPAFMSSRTERE